MTRGWRPRAVLGEALANVASAPLRALVVAAALGGGLAGLMWSELTVAADVRDQAAAFAAAGGHVAVVAGETGVDGAACDRLRAHPDVVAAGAMRGAGEVRAANAPGTRFARFEVTAGLVPVWDPAAAPPVAPGYVVGAAAAAELGLATGGMVSTAAGVEAVEVIDPSARNRFASRAFLDPVAPAGRFDQCWAELRPGAVAAGLRWLPAVFAADGATATANVDRGSFAADPGDVLASRPQRWAWVVVALVATALFALLALFRRAETAVYRAFGVSRSALLVGNQVEALLLVAGSFLAAACWAGLVYVVVESPPTWDQAILAVRTAGKAAAATAVVAPVLATLVGSGSPASLLKER